MAWRVEITSVAQKQIVRCPIAVQTKFQMWRNEVEHEGMEQARRRRGWNDHSLKGDRRGQRSIYLTKKYRAVYVIHKGGTVQIVEVVEVSRHYGD